MFIEPFEVEKNSPKTDDLGEMRKLYFNQSFEDYYRKHEDRGRVGFDNLPYFLGKMEREDNSLDYLKSSGVLILSECNDEVTFEEFRSQLNEWLVSCRERLIPGLTVDKDLKDVFGVVMKKHHELKQGRGSDIKFLSSSGVVSGLIPLSGVPGLKESVVSNLLDISSSANVLDRRALFENIYSIVDPDISIDLLTDMFQKMDVNETIDVTQSLSSRRLWSFVSSSLADVSEERCRDFWQSFLDYCIRKNAQGYDTVLEETVFDLVVSNDILFEKDIPAETLDWLKEHSLSEEIEVPKYNVKQLWEEMFNETFLGDVYSSLALKEYQDRFFELRRHLPDESPLVHEFIAQLMSVGLPNCGDKVDSWESWTHYEGFDWEKLSKSEPIQVLWKNILLHPHELPYQLGYWLSNFTVSSMEGVISEKLDIIEGVSLDAGMSSLCGFADIFMQESLLSNRVKVLYGGKLLFKEIGNDGALCTKDFKVVDTEGKVRIFKRGCFYTPVNGDWESGKWRFARPLGGDEIPMASSNLLHLSDIWLTKHGYTND